MKSEIASAACALGTMYSLAGVYTLDELEYSAFPMTSLGKVRKEILKDAIIRFRLNCDLERGPAWKEGRIDKDPDATLDSLLSMWADLTGIRPPAETSVAFFADSITLLRFCDRVWRTLRKRIYLEDFVKNDTLEKQARLVEGLDRQDQVLGLHSTTVQNDNNAIMRPHQATHGDSGEGAALPRSRRSNTTCYGNLKLLETVHENENVRLAVAKDRLLSLGLAVSDLEDMCPIRDALYRTVKGQRLQSFRSRMVFRVRNARAAQIKSAIEKALRSHAMLRTVLCSPSFRGRPFHSILKANGRLFDRVIHIRKVRNQMEAQSLYEDGSAEAHSSPFLFQAVILHVEEFNASLLYMTYCHSTIDAMAVLHWHQDLDALINDVEAVNAGLTPYKLFADLFEEYEESMHSRRAVEFHARRLRGISRFKRALWPEKRGPGWMIADDNGSSHVHERGIIRDRVWEGRWANRAAEFRYPRLGRVVFLPQMKQMHGNFGVSPALFTKCAITIFNVLQTNASRAIFNTWESGRSWPFVPDWIKRLLPPAMSIDGPTAQWIVNMIEVDNLETVGELLARQVDEQRRISCHEHVPWKKVLKELREEAEVAADASFRQSFIWDVGLGLALSRQHPGHQDFHVLEPVARYDWADG